MKLDVYKNEIIAMYTIDRLTTTEIAEYIGASQSGIERFLKRNGVAMKPHELKLKIPISQYTYIKQLYISGMTTVEIAEIFNTTDNTISKILKKQGVNIRKAARRSIVAYHDYFENINTNAKAYYLGWFITDGSVIVSKSRPNRTPVIAIELIKTDKYIIDKFAQQIGCSEEHVRITSTRNHTYFRFASSKMAQDLSRYGVIPNKTMQQYLPKLEEKYMPHLIRGIFDGNGTITLNKQNYQHLGFYGSKELCEQIMMYLHNAIGTNIHKVSKSTCYHVWFSDKEADKIYNYLYDNCGEYYLTRKKKKFKNDTNV